MKSNPFHLNAAGDFYVADGICLACPAPEHEAPVPTVHEEEGAILYHFYFRRQPAGLAEGEQAIRAVWVSCCGAVRYRGYDSAIPKSLKEFGAQDASDTGG